MRNFSILLFVLSLFAASIVRADEPIVKLVAAENAVERWQNAGTAKGEFVLKRGSVQYDATARSMELTKARYDAPTPKKLADAKNWTILAVARPDDSMSIATLASRDALVPFVQLDVDENMRARAIVRDSSGKTISATLPIELQRPCVVACVFETREDGSSSLRLALGEKSAQGEGILTGPLWGSRLQVGALDFADRNYSWSGGLTELDVWTRALSDAELSEAFASRAKEYGVDLSASEPSYEDSWDVLTRPEYAGPVAKEIEADVCIVGAGSAGIAAALRAAREGASVVLIERQAQIGGSSSRAMVSNWEGGPGDEIALELFNRMKESGGAGVAKDHPHKIDAPMGFRMIDPDEPYENSLVRANPPAGGYRDVAFLPSAFEKASRDALEETGRVQILTETTFFQAETNSAKTKVESVLVERANEDVWRVKARVFIDSTGDVWVCRDLGLETMIGMDPKSLFNEEGAPETRELQLNAMTRCYLIEPRENPKREIVADEDVVAFPKCAYVTGWIDGPRCVNMLPTLPGSSILELGYDECMRRSEKIVRNHWKWLQEQPGFENYELVEIAPMMGLREGYRVMTQYVLVESDIVAGWERQPHKDMIAVADHPRDRHGANGSLKPVETAYGVPYRCLLPKNAPKNLLVACRGAGFSSIAASSCRLQRTMMQLGSAAGIAAAWAARDGVDVDKIDVDALVKKVDARANYPHPARK